MDPTLSLSLRVLHVLGLIAWIGGTATALLVVVFVVEEAREMAALAARRAVLYVASPGLVLAWLAGLGMLLPTFSEEYARAGWMHGKLTIALVLTGLTGMLTGRLRRTARGATMKPAVFTGSVIVLLVLALIALALVQFQPGGTGS
jgi:putative membrane protein